MPNQTTLATIQKYILLATGIPSSSALREQLSQLHDQTGDFSQIAPLVDDFMTQQVLQNEKGVSGVLQVIASNGFSLDLTDSEADQLVNDFLAQGIDSWSKLFAFLTTGIDTELDASLNNRAEAASLFTDLLAERNLDNSYNSTQGTRDTREWLGSIDASNESLLVANSKVQSLVNSLVTVDLSALAQNDNHGGFVIEGYSSSISSAGDMNGDGLDDLIVHSPFQFLPSITVLLSSIIFGKSNGIAVDMNAITRGIGGYDIESIYLGKFSNAGDVNGDGLDDLIFGGDSDDPNRPESGTSFVVFGKTDGTENELSTIESGVGGFVINGTNVDDHSGGVSTAGDVNGDGLDDLIVETEAYGPNDSKNNVSFVVFGKTDSAAVELSDIKNGNGGFLINYENSSDFSQKTVGSAGDVNSDGLADLVIGTFNRETINGASFVVFGKSDSATLELSDIENGNGGFVINGESSLNFNDVTVSGAGDVNGDGPDDLIIGLSFDNTNGTRNGTSFVVFGKSNGAIIELSDIENGSGGFAISNVNNLDHINHSVSSAGDINGDGFADLIVGADTDDQNGSVSGAGFAPFRFSDTNFIVFGGLGSSATIGSSDDDILTGDNNANQLVAGMGDDTLVGNGGADVLRGGAGNDILAVSDLTFLSLDGGTGSDTLRFDAPLNLDLRTLTDTKLDSIEVIDLTNDGGTSTISLNLTDLLNINEAQTASDTLVIHGNTGDIVNLDNTSNGQIGTWTDAGAGVYQFSVGGIGVIGTVTIDADITVNIM